MIPLAFTGLTKRYGPVTAVSELSAQIQPGRVTAFLGANGSGKTTSMRVLLGLTRPTSGSATIGGRAYRELRHPARVVGAVLDQGFHPHRSARQHLLIAAAQVGAPRSRADDLLNRFGLGEAAGRRVGGYSLGMRQRLALATAMVGDPGVLVLDEPFNGLDPGGITTLRDFLRTFAAGGGTVLLSSHLLSEVEQVADNCLIIDLGVLVTAGPISALPTGPRPVSVVSHDAEVLAAALASRGATVDRTGDRLAVTGLPPSVIGATIAATGAVITSFQQETDDLEGVFAALVQKARTSATPPPVPQSCNHQEATS